MKTSNFEKMTFKPRASSGWMWVTLLGLTPLAAAVMMAFQFGFKGPALPTILLGGTIGMMFLVIAVFFPTMKYEMEGSSLILTYGPLLRYSIDVKQIKSIRRLDLRISPLSSFRFPGLAIFGVPYPEIGSVNMCATAASHGILLIETGSAKYGMTPENEEAFISELRRRIDE